MYSEATTTRRACDRRLGEPAIGRFRMFGAFPAAPRDFCQPVRKRALLSNNRSAGLPPGPPRPVGSARAYCFLPACRRSSDSAFAPQARYAALNGTLQFTDLGTVCAFIDETLHARAVHRVFYHRMCFGSGSTARGLLVRSEQLRRFDSEGRITQASAAIRLERAALRLAYCMVRTAGPIRRTAGNAGIACCASARPNGCAIRLVLLTMRSAVGSWADIAWACKPPPRRGPEIAPALKRSRTIHMDQSAT